MLVVVWGSRGENDAVSRNRRKKSLAYSDNDGYLIIHKPPSSLAMKYVPDKDRERPSFKKYIVALTAGFSSTKKKRKLPCTSSVPLGSFYELSLLNSLLGGGRTFFFLLARKTC